MLAGKPVQIIGGGRMDRGAIAIIGWARRSRLRVASVYNSHETDPGHEEHLRRIFDQMQAYLAEIASVPWVIGGDWNIVPGQADHHRDRSQARPLDLGTATQRQCRHLDRMIARFRAPAWVAEFAGTDHVRAQDAPGSGREHVRGANE